MNAINLSNQNLPLVEYKGHRNRAEFVRQAIAEKLARDSNQ